MGVLEEFCTRLELVELAGPAAVNFGCTTDWGCAFFASYLTSDYRMCICCPIAQLLPIDSGACSKMAKVVPKMMASFLMQLGMKYS